MKATRDARLAAKQTKRLRQKRQSGLTSEDVLGDDDLESMESLDIGGDEVDAHDIDMMFGQKDSGKQADNGLFDYSDLMETMQGAHEDDLNSGVLFANGYDLRMELGKLLSFKFIESEKPEKIHLHCREIGVV